MSEERESGVVVGHTACPDCGSSDALAVHLKQIESGPVIDAYCWSSNHDDNERFYSQDSLVELGAASEYFNMNDVEYKKLLKVSKSKKNSITIDEYQKLSEQTTYNVTYRGIRPEILQKFGHRVKLDSKGEPSVIYYPETNKDIESLNGLSGYKARRLPKNFHEENIGRTGTMNQLSGQHLFANSTGRYILVVGGENDKAAAYQMLRDMQKDKDYDTIPVVSPTSGEGSAAKQMAANYDFLDQFEWIVVGMDSDEAGETSTEEIIKILPSGKVKVATWSMKDPHKMLESGKQKQFVREFYAAKEVVYSGVKTSIDADGAMEAELSREKIPLPAFMSELQKIMAGGIPLGYLVTLGAQTGGGKCLGKGTLVMMHDMSVKPVEEIKVGDVIMGDDGSPRNVLSTCKGREPLYKVKQHKGMDYVVNESHILSLRASYSKMGLSCGEVVDINIKDYLDTHKTKKHQLKGYVGDLTELGRGLKVESPRMLGIWLADGSTTTPVITVASKDKELKGYIGSWCKSKGFSMSSPKEKGNCRNYYISGGMMGWLRELGVLGDKHIPKPYLQADYKDRLELLSGILDCDGYSVGYCYEITLKTGKLPWDVVKLARSLGFRVSARKVKKGCQNDFVGDYVRIFIKGDVAKLDLLLPRKRAKGSKARTGVNTGIELEPLGIGDYYGFEIDGNRRFCLEDGTVTHNTTLVNEMLYYWLWKSPYKVGVVSLELNAGQYHISMLSRHIGKKIQLIEDPKEAVEFVNQPWVVDKRKELMVTDDGEPRYVLLDDRDGDLDTLKLQIEKLIRKYGCKTILIDPIQDAFEGASLDEQTSFIKYLKTIIKDGIAVIVVAHITKGKTEVDKKTGKRVMRMLTEDDFAGVSNLAKSSGCTILTMRDKYADDPVEKNTTYVDVGKCRWSGRTGHAGKWYYEPESHTMYDLNDWLSGQTDDIVDDIESDNQEGGDSLPNF